MPPSLFLLLLTLIMITTNTAAAREPRSLPPAHPPLISWTTFDNWERTSTGAQTTLTSPEVATPAAWNELVASWNAQTPFGSALRLEVRALYPGRVTKFYDLGYWAGAGHVPPRTSLSHQKDADGDVATDTLLLSAPATRLQVRLTLEGPVTVAFVSLAPADTRARTSARPPNRAAWGRTLDVPERSQLSYPGGGQSWCSPTSLSMVMTYWAHQEHRPAWAVDVPEAVQGTYDAAWEGTGNWPFNTAYAGSFPGLRAYVTRFADLRELEDWIAAGVPVILSVGYNAAIGGDTPGTNGHIIVCVGFTKTGDPIINDPWTRFEKGEHVRRVFRRERLATMWAHSKNAVYLVYPTDREEHRHP